MRQCWADDPLNRPSFMHLAALISKLLEDGIEYLKLDIPLVSNPGYEYFSQTDQLLPHELENEDNAQGSSNSNDLENL